MVGVRFNRLFGRWMCGLVFAVAFLGALQATGGQAGLVALHALPYSEGNGCQSSTVPALQGALELLVWH